MWSFAALPGPHLHACQLLSVVSTSRLLGAHTGTWVQQHYCSRLKCVAVSTVALGQAVCCRASFEGGKKTSHCCGLRSMYTGTAVFGGARRQLVGLVYSLGSVCQTPQKAAHACGAYTTRHNDCWSTSTCELHRGRGICLMMHDDVVV